MMCPSVPRRRVPRARSGTLRDGADWHHPLRGLDPVLHCGGRVSRRRAGKRGERRAHSGRRGAARDPAGDERRARHFATVDVVFPVLHGPFGEDGTVQGLAEIAGVAYVGSGVMGWAAAMDKDVAKRLMRDAGLPIARFPSFQGGDRPSFDAVVAELGRPVFVKPARLGSSVGISKAGTRGGVR